MEVSAANTADSIANIIHIQLTPHFLFIFLIFRHYDYQKTIELYRERTHSRKAQKYATFYHFHQSWQYY